MTDCSRIMGAVLDADPRDLRGEGDTEVARHVRACPRCREAAERILADTRALDEALDEGRPPLDVDAVLERAGIPAATTPGRGRVGPPRWSRWTALAAAAVVATLLFVRSGDLPRAPTPTPGVADREAGPPPTVESASEDVAVIQTDNPDITVVWFLRGGEG